MWVIPCFLSAGGALLLGGVLVRKKTANPIFVPLSLLMALVAWIHGINGVGLLVPEYLLTWKKLVLFGELFFPSTLAYVNYTFQRDIFSHSDADNHFLLWVLMTTGAVLSSIVLFLWSESMMRVTSNGEVVFARLAGIGLWGFILLALVVGLSQLEQILRSTRDPLRFQMKFVLIGLGGLAGISVAQASQLLLLPVWKQAFPWVGGIATCLSLILMAFGLARWRIYDFSQKVQVSHQALYTSLTFLLVGGYLILVGIVARVIQDTGWEIGEALGALFLFMAAIALAVILVSRQARAELQQFVGRHFFRTKYDYKKTWLEITEAFSSCACAEEIWDRYLEWLSCTFGAPRVTIWKCFDVDGRFHQIRTINTQEPPHPLQESHTLIQEIKLKKEPFLLDRSQAEEDGLEEFFQRTDAHLCVPLVHKRALLGFCTLSKELHDRTYDQDDCDLLRAIAHHVTMLLIQFQLQEERSASAKWEAVHKFSGFYLHDLKNLASSLSMVVQNADRHGHDPEFQASAMQTVRKTSQRVMDLMAKLATQSKGLSDGGNKDKQLAAVDMNVLIHDMLQGLNGSGCHHNFNAQADLPKLRLEVESIKQVLLNVILNARQAMNEKGSIDIATRSMGKRVKIEIVDTGPGIPISRLESLFQPFQSSKKTGLGVGLYQCKQIVEDNRGTIHIESREGHGTKVILTFPTETADKQR